MSAAIPFSEAPVESHPFGWLAAVSLPEGLEPVAAAVLARLDPAEAAHARTLRGRRQIEWTGGRLALRAAARAAGLALPAVLPGARGEPLLPPAVQASISHKRAMALALVGTGPACLGLDVEEPEPARPAIASRVLRDEELAAVEALPEAERWPAILRRFAAKEAIYKALHPHVRRYVAFSEASVSLEPPGAILHLAHGEGPFAVALDLRVRSGLLLAAVRIAALDVPGAGA